MTTQQKSIAIIAGAAVAGFALSAIAARSLVRSRCRKTVRDACAKVPLLGEEFCNEQAEAICNG